ncbi:MAG TPA: hypothetical protein VN915_11830 [Elusimicrobiota bacterium]|nr:hypothetical protein [Elusimicrobiota bacterium]
MRIARRALSALAAFLCVSAAAGPLVATIPEVGPHYRVVTVRKSVHPRNDLVVYTRLDDECRIVRQGDSPALDFYWLMDRRSFKPVNPLIKRGIRKRLEVETGSVPDAGADSFSVRLNELKEVQHDLGPNPRLRVRSSKTARGCRAEARMTLGPSDKNAEIRLDEIYSEAELKGRFSAKVKLVALKGTDVKTGKRIVRVYRAK